MRWFLAGLAFASVVGLAVATAAIETRNAHRRMRIQQLVDRLDAARIAEIAEQLRYRDATGLRQLVAHWLRLQEQLDRATKGGGT
jgi:hypothetical protein